jgi:hypothetical protein
MKTAVQADKLMLVHIIRKSEWQKPRWHYNKQEKGSMILA